MRLPNGFGSVYKLSGKRRKPFAARKTTGFTWNEEKQKSYPIYEFIGYYETKKEALQALADYNKDPYDIGDANLTLAELYKKWSAEHFPKVSESNIHGYKAAWKLLGPIQKYKIADIKLDHLQKMCDDSGKNYPTLRKLKSTLGLMYDYTVKHEILPKEKREMIKFLDIKKAGNPNKLDRTPFSKAEIKTLWDMVKTDEYYQIPLILIYTGLRVSELWNLKRENVNLDKQWFYVEKSKTPAGVRYAPIADKILPFFKHWMDKGTEYVFTNRSGDMFTDKNFRDAYWKPVMDGLNMKHLPHDARHTCVSLLTVAKVPQVMIRKIVGHSGKTVTENTYTHLDVEEKLEAINKI